jgi:GH43 family beta-xylosidase
MLSEDPMKLTGRLQRPATAAMYSVLACVSAGSQSQPDFTNPIIARGADPSVVLVDGVYYSVQSGCQHTGANPVICIRAARSLPDLGKVKLVPVWIAPGAGPNAHDIWAPEIENFDGKWYIYYAADPDENPHHALFALVPRIPDRPLGEWVEADTGAPSGGFQLDWKSNWAIDPSVFKASDGQLYLLFACRQDNTNQNPGRYQSICIAEMSDPLHLQANPLTGKKVVELSLPTQAWETRGFPTEEGPFGFTRDGVDYVLYSASFSGTPDEYAVGMLINQHPPQPHSSGNSLLNPASWVKEGPVFDGHHAAYGTASSVLVASPDHTEIWNVYHGTNCIENCVLVQNKTWADRSVRAQEAGWSATGDLVLGYPVDIEDTDGHGKSVPLPPPSTDGRGRLVLAPWGAAFGDAAEGDLPDGTVTGNWTVSGPGAIRLDSLDGSQLDRSFYASNPNFQNYVVYTQFRLIEKGSGATTARFGVIGAYVDRDNYFMAMVQPEGCGANGCLVTQAWVGGNPDAPRSCPLPDGFSPDQRNVLVVEAVSGTFKVLVNDRSLEGPCQGRHFSLDAGQVAANGSNGQAGVAAQNAKVEFTSFQVSPGVPVDSGKSDIVFAFRNVQSQMEMQTSCGDCAHSTIRTAKQNESAGVIQFPAAAPYPLTAWPGQLWKLEEDRDDFSIVNAMTNLCLDTVSASSVTSAVERRCNGADTQRWEFLPAPQRSSFVIRNEATQTVLDAAGTQRGALLTLRQRTDQPSQMWQLISP